MKPYFLLNLTILIFFFLVFSIFTFTVSVTRISSLKISQTKASFLIKAINYSLKDGLLLISFNEIEAISRKNKTKQLVVDKITLGVNLYKLTNRTFSSLQRNFPVFNLVVEGLDLQAIRELYSNKDSYNKILSVELPVIFSNWMEFFNSRYFRDFSLYFKFKNLGLEPQFMLDKNQLQVKEIRITGPDKVESHIAEVAIVTNLNNNEFIIQGLIERLKAESLYNDKGQKEKIFQPANYPLKLQLYGFIKNKLYFSGFLQRLAFDDFIRLNLFYNPAAHNITFDFTTQNILMNSVFIEKNLIRLKSLQTAGIFNIKEDSLTLSNYQTILLEDSGLETPLLGNMYLSKNRFHVTAENDKIINHDLIYSYWSNKYGNKARAFLQKLVKKARIQKATVALSMEKNHEPQILANLKLANSELDYYNRDLYFDELTLDISRQMINVSAASCIIDKKVTLGRLRSSNDLLKKYTTISFDSSLKSQVINHFIKEIKIPKGEIALSASLAIPWNNFEPKLTISNLRGSIDGKKIKSNKIDLLIDKDKFKISGGINYEGFLFNSIKATLNKSNPYQKENYFSAEIPTKFIENALPNKGLALQGDKIEIFVTLNGLHKGSAKINLNGVGIQNNLRLNKKEKDPGRISFDFLHKNSQFEIKNFILNLPEVKVLSDMIIQDGKILSGSWDFKNYYNSKILVSQSQEGKYTVALEDYDLKDLLEETSVQASTNQTLLPLKADITLSAKNLKYDGRELFDEGFFLMEIDRNQIQFINAKALSKEIYFQLFFSDPVLAMTIDNLGKAMQQLSGSKVLKKGAFVLYGKVEEKEPLAIAGTAHLKNFTLLESYLLSTILRLYSLGGRNITSFMKTGLDFNLINCDFKSKLSQLSFNHCQAVSDQVLLRADSHYNLVSGSGIIEGMVFPTSLVNLPMILLQKTFRSKKSFLDGFEHKKNFTVLFEKGKKPIIRTNPISFVLPSIFSFLFASNKTMDY